MRRQFLLWISLCLTVSLVWAERIDLATARKVAQTVAESTGEAALRSSEDLSLVYAAAPGKSASVLRSGTVNEDVDYFVFNFPSNGGFAIVAGDDRVHPILGYSDEGNFDPNNLPDNLRSMLAYYQDQISWAVSNVMESSPEISAEWNRYLSGVTLRAAGDILPTALWNQSEPFNRQTPSIEGEQTLTGCVATAMGIIMKYHNYPEKAVNPPAENTYGIDGRAVTSQILYDNYDWKNMLDSYKDTYNDVQADAVAKLLWHCGANVSMNYGLNESGAPTKMVAKALSDVFGYSPSIRYLTKEAYRWAEWKDMLREELDAGYPFIYNGRNIQKGSGHAFVCDGYTAEGLFHINWGWGGLANGYFILSVLDDNGDGYGYSDEQGAVLNIRPQRNGDKYIYKPYLNYATYIVEPGKVQVDFGFTYSAFEDQTVYIGLGIVDSEGLVIQAPIDPLSDKLKAYPEGWRIYSDWGHYTYVSYSSLPEGQRLTLLCSIDGNTWEVMNSLETVPLGVDNKGVIEATLDNPDDPEQPLNAQILWNQFDECYLAHSGLDNNKSNSDNCRSICYRFSNVKENIIVRYVINNYSEWENQLAVYYGDDYSITEANKGTNVSINNGYFDIPIKKEDLDNGIYYYNYLKILSNRRGELTYDIQVYSESDQSPVFESKGNKLQFVTKTRAKINPKNIQGNVNEEIPFTLTFTESDASFENQELALNITIDGAKEDQIQLVGPDGKIVELVSNETNDTYLSTEQLYSVGTFSLSKSYSFKIKSNTEFTTTYPTISIRPYIQGKRIAAYLIDANLRVEPSTVNLHSINADLYNLAFQDGTPTKVEDGQSFSGYLVCTKEGYTYPKSIEVEMEGEPLVLEETYRYNPKTGLVVIMKVTGDVLIKAQAEQIPVVENHIVTAAQLEGMTSDIPVKGKEVKDGENLNIELKAKEGYLLPTEITVKSNGSDYKDYTYTTSEDRKTGTLLIRNITSDIQIYASAIVAPKTFTVKQELINVTSDKPEEVKVLEGESINFTLKPVQNYRLPEGIIIMNGENPLVSGTDKDYTYDKETGKVVIFRVTSDLTLKAIGVDNRYFEVVLKLDGVKSEPNSIDKQFLVNEKAVFNVKFTAAEGYTYDGNLEVNMGGDLLLSGEDYTYDSSTGEFKLLKGITTTLTLMAKGVKNMYDVELDATGLVSNLEEGKQIAHGDPLSFKITPEEGYKLPESIAVTMGGKPVSDYTYSMADGSVYIAKVTGDVVITAKGILKSYLVMLHLTGLSSDLLEDEIEHGSALSITLSPMTGYELPESVIVMMNGEQIKDYTYKNGTIQIGKVVGPVEITAKGIRVYEVTSPSDVNITLSGVSKVKEGETFSGKLEAKNGYKLPYTVSVKMGGQDLSEGQFSYNNETGEIVIKSVDGPIVIIAKGIEVDKFEVILNLINITSNPASFEPQSKDSKVELTLAPASGYLLPATVSVTMGDKSLVSGTDYTYDKETGKFVLENLSGTLIVTAYGEKEPTPGPDPDPDPDPDPTPVTYTVTLPVVEGAIISAEGSTSVKEGESFYFTIELKEGYVAKDLTVKVNGTEILPESDGRYKISNIRTNVVVTVSGIEKGNPTSLESLGITTLKVWGNDGILHIQTPSPVTAYIVTFDGRLYKTLILPAGDNETNIPQGSYLINIGKQSFKIRL